jgi:hypothetical protein
MPLEGGGDLRTAFLKDCRARDYQKPQCGEEDEGGQSCNHRILSFLGAPNHSGHVSFQIRAKRSVEAI